MAGLMTRYDRSVNQTVEWPDITSRIASGDAESFGVYYDVFFDLMFSEARRLSGADEATCFDFVHDAMLKAMRRMKRMKDRVHLEAWTRVVVRSVVFDKLRFEVRERQARQERMEISSDDENRHAENQARLLWVEEQLQEVSPELRQLIDYRYRLGWTLRQIGERLGMKAGRVDGRIRRYLQQLRVKAEETYD